jgi:hypothetical protein
MELSFHHFKERVSCNTASALCQAGFLFKVSVKAGLVIDSRDYLWSSAHYRNEHGRLLI